MVAERICRAPGIDDWNEIGGSRTSDAAICQFWPKAILLT